MKQELAKLDRSRPHVLNMIVGDKFIYARASPTQYAYAHPESPQLPPELLQSPQDKEARYRRTEETLKIWLKSSSHRTLEAASPPTRTYCR